MTFADRDDCVLIFTPPGTDVPPVRITHPITVVSMKAALREAGVPNNKIRVSSTTYVGRMGPVIQQVKQQEQAERAQKHKESTAFQAVVMKSSASSLERQRSELILEKHQVDDDIRKTQGWIGEAKTTAYTTGQYANPTHFRQQEAKIVTLRERSLAIQAKLGELRTKIKEENKRNSAHPSKESFFNEFRQVAYETLPKEQYMQIAKLAGERLEAREVAEDEEKGEVK